MIKPDGVSRGLIGSIIQRFEQRGFSLKGLKLVVPSRDLLAEHYGHLAGKPFFNDLMLFMESGPVVAMVWEGTNVVQLARTMLGPTNPAECAPGSIRGDFAVSVSENVCHGSDSVQAAAKEIKLWFKEGI